MSKVLKRGGLALLALLVVLVLAVGILLGTQAGSRWALSLVPGLQSMIARGTTFSAQVEVKTYVDERDTQARSREQWDGGGHFAVDTF